MHQMEINEINQSFFEFNLKEKNLQVMHILIFLTTDFHRVIFAEFREVFLELFKNN